MRWIPLLPVIAVTLAAEAVAQTAAREQRVLADVQYLASDALGGRQTCRPGNDSAAAYLVRTIRALGATPIDTTGWLQPWTTGSTTATRQGGIESCRTANVLGAFRGRGNLAHQVVIVGAHFDHLGSGPFGSLSGDSGQIHNGADDNASGTSAVLEVARLLQRDRALRDNRPRRTVIVAFWSGEEQGALGSAHFASALPWPAESVLAYLNFDMVGRMRDNKLLALGARTATEWPALLDSVNARAQLDLRASGDGWGPSDHASFYAKHIPVLHFFTDTHEDYHRPSDDAERINARGIVQVADFTAQLIRRLDQLPRLTFVDVPPPAPVASGGRPRPSLGTIPDMSDEPGGVRLSGVRAGSAADSAGMRAGDVLTGIGTHTITNLQDFQNALMAHAAGDRVEIRWRRGTETMAVTVTLGGRPN